MVYVKTLYRIGGQDYCWHHIIRAPVASGVITKVKAGDRTVVAVARECIWRNVPGASPSGPMCAITLYQPWASLMALGIKSRRDPILVGAVAAGGPDRRHPRRQAGGVP